MYLLCIILSLLCDKCHNSKSLISQEKLLKVLKTIFKKVRTERVLKLYNTLILPTFLYGSENWTLTASQRRRIEAVEMELLRPLAGYTLYDHKTSNSICKELRITSILDKIDEYRKKRLLHIQRMAQT